MNVRQKVLFKIKSINLQKKELPKKVSSYFGENTFSLSAMNKHISKNTFAAFKRWMSGGVIITLEQANEIADAMKNWAMSKGATYYTHWFQPMTGLTAEKHDSFISITGPGKVIERFSGSKLIQGEPDASSFPSGGIRATFEARGYTAWDPSSPAFIIESSLGKTLCIPTIFISYHGEALDKKLPLLRSDEALSKAAIGLLKLFGHHKDVKKVFSTCGAEQEYFLIDKNYYNLRQDLVMTGRTLIGAASPKGQQLEDQYFGTIKERVVNFMFEVAEEAYKLGIPVMTRHNEVAPHQYEFAPIFEESNIAADHNQLLMEVMKKVALRHNMVCLLHEKPFAGINGSGKHLNWSLSDDKGNNLLNPGDTPEGNLQFLAVLAAVLRAVYIHSDLLRASVAMAGNEHRLGANEAPPAIISVFLGDQLTNILNMLEKGVKTSISKKDIMDFGIARLPKFNKDTTDRNRTSPFAFTGAKFEFRAVGSSQNISTPITVINAIIAESLDYVAENIRQAAKGKDFNTAVLKVISRIAKETKDIRFEGNNYAPEWISEAKKRGLPNIASTAQALKALTKDVNINLFEKYKIFSKEEIVARYHIWLHTYNTILDIEANTLNEMVNANVVPAGYEYERLLADNLNDLANLKKNSALKTDKAAFNDLKDHLVEIATKIYYVRRNTKEMMKLMEKAQKVHHEERAVIYFDKLKPLMEHIRKHVDQLERVVSDEHWDLPKYREMLFIK